MKNNKLYLKLILIITLFSMLFSIIMFIYMTKINSKLSNNEDKVLNIRTIESLNCEHKPKLYYEAKDYNVYTYCLDSITIVDYYIMELSAYISNNPNVFDNLFKNLAFYTYWDGGTKEYKDYRIPKISNNGITIIKCNGRGDVTNDIYIGPETMTYKENFCKEDNSTFTKIFKVTEIQKDTLNNVILTLEYKNSSAKISTRLDKDYQIGVSYEFEFMGEETEDTITSILDNSRIVEIREINN